MTDRRCKSLGASPGESAGEHREGADAGACQRSANAANLKRLGEAELRRFDSASRHESSTVAEEDEPAVALTSMRCGHEVAEDYACTGLSLCDHSVAFLREGLRLRGTISCAHKPCAAQRSVE